MILCIFVYYSNPFFVQFCYVLPPQHQPNHRNCKKRMTFINCLVPAWNSVVFYQNYILSQNATKLVDNPKTPDTKKSVPCLDSATQLGLFLFLEFCEFVHSITAIAKHTTIYAGGLNTSNLLFSNLSIDGFCQCIQKAWFCKYDPFIVLPTGWIRF